MQKDTVFFYETGEKTDMRTPCNVLGLPCY